MRPYATLLPRRDMRAMVLVACALLVAGCNGDDDDNRPDPPQTTGSTAETGTTDTSTITTSDPLVKRNRQGSVVMLRDGALKDGDEGYYKLFAVFGSDLNSVGTGQLCVERGVCIHDLPEGVGDYVELDQFFRSAHMDFDWVGERVAIGNSPRDWFEIPFQYLIGFSADEQVELQQYGFYAGSESRLDRDENPPLGIRIEEGEWGDNVEIEAEAGLPLPFLARLSTPTGAVVTPSAVLTFDWMWPPDPKPPELPIDRGDSPMFLRVRANELHRIYRLPQEGPFDLELGALGLNDSSQVEFYFGRWDQREARFNSNDLFVYGGIEKRISTPGCSPTSLPTVNLSGTTKNNGKDPINVATIGVSFDGLLLDEDIYDYGWDAKGSGTPTPTSASLTFTAYDAQQQALCTVQYDASRATPVATNTVQTQNAARVFGAWSIDLGNGISDCPMLENRVFEGYGGLHQALEDTDWIIGIGELGATSAETLEPVYGDDWATVEQQLYGLYVQRVLTGPDLCETADVVVDVELGAVEVGAGFLYQTESCGVLNPARQALTYRPGIPMKGGVYNLTSVLPFDVVHPECPDPTKTTN